MDIYDEEFIKFWTSLNNNNVDYIMVGGVATNFNGYQRSTDDIDVWIKDSAENRQKPRKAFYDYWGIDFFMIETMQIIPGGQTLILITEQDLI